MIGRLRLLGAAVSGTVDEMGRGVGQAVCHGERAMAWIWNGFKALPGVHHVGRGLATVLRLRGLDQADDLTVAWFASLAVASSSLIAIALLHL